MYLFKENIKIHKAFTMAGAGQRERAEAGVADALSIRHATPFNASRARERASLFDWLTYGHVAFTMAEILLSLTIIGVVAAITLPSLTGNINERTWNTQRKALYSRMSQAISLMPALNGYNDTESFIAAGLSKVLKINNICDNTHLTDCGFKNKIIALKGNASIASITNWEDLNSYTTAPVTTWGSRTSIENSNAAAFETQNGESVLTLYNKNCRFYMDEKTSSSAHEYHYSTQEKVCLNFIYDLNGGKGPNTVGKDIGFITVLYPTDSVIVAPLPRTQLASEGSTFNNAISLCKQQGEESRLPNQDELTSLYINQKLVNGNLYEGGTNYWSAISVSATLAWAQGLTTGDNYIKAKTDSFKVICIER